MTLKCRKRYSSHNKKNADLSYTDCLNLLFRERIKNISNTLTSVE